MMEERQIVINKKKLMILVTLIAVVIIIIAIVNINKNKSDYEQIYKTENTQITDVGEKINTSNKLKESRESNGLYIDKIQLKNVSNKTTFTANITNKTNTTTKGQLYDIVFVDKEGKQVETMGLYIRAIEPNQMISVEASMEKDVTECYNFNLRTR